MANLRSAAAREHVCCGKSLVRRRLLAMLEDRECENCRSRGFVLYRREDANNAKDYLCTIMETLLAFLRVQE
jgi:hypothetical protein